MQPAHHRQFILILYTFVASLGFYTANAQVLINEVCSKNNSVLLDAEGDSPDWLELYNAGASDVDLEDFYLSDDTAHLELWELPSIDLQAGEHLLIFCSGKDVELTHHHTNFKISQGGETLVLSDDNGVVLDQLSPTFIGSEHSFGRYPSGGNSLYYYDEPTPESQNSTSFAYLNYAGEPALNSDAGFYHQYFFLNAASASANASIFFTQDGSPPTQNSPLFGDDVYIASTQVIKFRAFADSLLPSPIVTNSYFIAENTTLPVVSISCKDSLLFDSITGLHVTGPNADSIPPHFGANYWEDWTIPVNFEFFDLGGEQELNMTVDLKIHGGTAARTRTQKPLRLMARKKYGDDHIEYPMFPNSSTDDYKRLVLRNSGGDFKRFNFRDGLLHRTMITGGLDIDLINFRPSAVFINGRYWGVMNIREKIDRYYLKYHYGIDENAVDLLEEDSTVIEGDFTAFDAMHDFIVNQDLSDDGLFSQATALVDESNLADYFIAETYLTNTDWPYNNMKFWRAHGSDTRWRYLLFDLDGSLNLTPWATHATDNLGRILSTFGDANKHVNILSNMLENDEYRRYFINRYADLINTTFGNENMLSELEMLYDEVQSEMIEHTQLWAMEYGAWQNEIDIKVERWINERPAFARQYVQDNFSLVEQVTLHLNVYPPEAGTIQINTIAPELPWDGVYFNGNPVTLTAIPNPGYSFKRWESLNVVTTPNRQTVLTQNFDQDDAITAHFDGAPVGLSLAAKPNPTADQVKLSFVLNQIDAVEIEVRSLAGDLLQKFTKGDFNAGANHFYVDLSSFATGIYFITATTSESTATVKIVKTNDAPE
jgi:hypothetical protein